MDSQIQKNEALGLVNELLYLTERAESSLTSARNWSFLDLIGGGLITDLIKHSKVSSARSSMERANALMERLRDVLGSMAVPPDISIKIGGFSTFADFLFDGIVFDGYMTFKIMDNLNELAGLKQKLYCLRQYLEGRW